jgi:hypothetical protein
MLIRGPFALGYFDPEDDLEFYIDWLFHPRLENWCSRDEWDNIVTVIWRPGTFSFVERRHSTRGKSDSVPPIDTKVLRTSSTVIEDSPNLIREMRENALEEENAEAETQVHESSEAAGKGKKIDRIPERPKDTHEDNSRPKGKGSGVAKCPIIGPNKEFDITLS